jgi:ABC-2 type transport system permease protein
MLNVIKADLYRLFRSKGFYITMILAIVYIILQTAASSTGGVMVMVGDGPVSVADSEGNILYSNIPPAFTGSTAPFHMMNNTDTLLYFLLPFIVFIAAADFSTDTVKNVLANGMSRVKYYLSKLVLSCIFCVILLLAQTVFSIITATVLRGFDGTFDIEFIGRLVRPLSAQLFMCLSVVCMGIFFAFITKRTAAVVGTYIAFCMVPLMLMIILFLINNSLEFLFRYDVISNIRMLASIDLAETADIIRAFAIGGVYILASTIGGIALFKRSEIK